MTITRSTLLAIIAVLLSPMAANAVPITWKLQDVTFDDGGIATGTFTYDADTNSVSTWSIVTSGGNETFFPSPFTYDSNLANQSAFVFNVGADSQAFLFDSDTSLAGSRDFRIDPISLLTNAGGTVALDLTNFNFNVECFNCAPFRLIAGGSVTTSVPEPGTLALLGIGLAAMGLSRRRRKI